MFVLLAVVLFTRVYGQCGLDYVYCGERAKELRTSGRGGMQCTICEDARISMSERVWSLVPSPHSELLLGTTLGLDFLYRVPRFNDVLISTGTIHIVVVSGYNISLVFNRIINLFKSNNNFWYLFIAQVGAVIYSIITGFEPPIVRALLMVSVVIWGRYLGRNVNLTLLLTLLAVVMGIFNPFYLWNLSFQLSFLATFGIVTLSKRFETVFSKLFGRNVFSQDLSASVAAQLLVLPLIYYVFGRVSVVGILFNALILWVVPIVTVLGMAVLLAMYIHPFTGYVMSLLYLPFSHIFVETVLYVGNLVSMQYLIPLKMLYVT